MYSDMLAAATAAPVITALVAAIGQAVPALPRRTYPIVSVPAWFGLGDDRRVGARRHRLALGH
jgi:hypothetical protein